MRGAVMICWVGVMLMSNTLMAQDSYQIQSDSLLRRTHLPNYMLKVDMLSLIQRVGRLSFGGQITAAYERRIRLPWTGIIELGVPYRANLGDQPLSLPGLNYRAQTILGIRWYYRIRQRLALYPRLSPFSSNYVSLLSRTRILPKFQPNGSPAVAYLFVDEIGVGFVYGIQRRLSTKSFFDMQGGILGNYQLLSTGASRWDWGPHVSLRLGLAQ
ncbi:MAG: hypothetical protein AAFV07_06115 [Bacteroidota bacterium]